MTKPPKQARVLYEIGEIQRKSKHCMLTERLWASYAPFQNRTELIYCKRLQNRTEYDQVAPLFRTSVGLKQIYILDGKSLGFALRDSTKHL